MTPKQRQITQEQIDKFEAVLRDPMRSLRMIEEGYDPIIIKACDDGMRSVVEDLKQQLSES